MKKLLFISLFSILFANQNARAQVEVTNYGDIPLERLAISRWQHFEWDGSGTWQTIDVTTKGITPNSSVERLK